MKSELAFVWQYVCAVAKQWWVIVVEGLLVLTDIFERLFGTWLLPSTRVKAGIGIAVLVIAQYRAYRSLLIQLRSREDQIRSTERKKTELLIYPEGESCLYVEIASGGGGSKAIYFEFRLCVQNNGERNSVVRRFDIEILETGRKYQNVAPSPRNSVLTRQAQHMLMKDWILTHPSSIVVPANDVRCGALPLYISEAVSALPSHVQCKLRLEDSEGTSAENTFAVRVIG